MYAADRCTYMSVPRLYASKKEEEVLRHTIWQSIIDTWRESRSFVTLHARGIAIRCTKRCSLFEDVSRARPEPDRGANSYRYPGEREF